ncbi:hypothetical protein PR202_gb16362 [Eleusine coracana subsp. coracana]|uniref:AB hydrolase-1 domain-containing protein n=1 Tax=Eleusine coracana subsp. coracana TaxID=191504 RepID=A0AAV5F0A8_ELECO|nr:hypothetical protein PR202_gb16362 [Eleusine coracana subsp. coracana]
MCHSVWSWYRVATALDMAGHNVTALDMIGCGARPWRGEEVASFEEYNWPLLDVVVALLEGKKVVPIAHSFGGQSLALDMERYPKKVVVAVFVTATMPATGKPIIYAFKQGIAMVKLSWQFLNDEMMNGDILMLESLVVIGIVHFITGMACLLLVYQGSEGMARVAVTARPGDSSSDEERPLNPEGTATEVEAEHAFAESLEGTLVDDQGGEDQGSRRGSAEGAKEEEEDDEEGAEQDGEDEDEDEEDEEFHPRDEGKIAADSQAQGSSPRVRSSDPLEESLEDVEVEIDDLLPIEGLDQRKARKGKSKEGDGERPRTLVFGRSRVKRAVISCLVDLGCFDVTNARLPGQEDVPAPRKDEAVVFEEHFTVGIRFPCSSFLGEVLDRFDV